MLKLELWPIIGLKPIVGLIVTRVKFCGYISTWVGLFKWLGGSSLTNHKDAAINNSRLPTGGLYSFSFSSIESFQSRRSTIYDRSGEIWFQIYCCKIHLCASTNLKASATFLQIYNLQTNWTISAWVTAWSLYCELCNMKRPAASLWN